MKAFARSLLNRSKNTWLFPGIFFLMIVFLLFYHLDARTFRLWDESRLALNAASMFLDGNYFFTSYQNAPDFWNTKPHLLIILQVMSMKLFGFTEGSVRLPSSLATLFSSGLVYYWIRKEKYSFFYACLGVLVFLCTRFLSFHGARAGDYDALLILWQLSYCFAFFEFIQTKRQSFLALGFIALTLAVLTKGIAGLLFTPGIALFALLRKELGLFFKAKMFYLGLIIFVVSIGGYYWVHELLTPGYLQTVYFNEIGGRYFKAIEDHQGNYSYYLRSFSLISFYFLPVGLLGVIHLLRHPVIWSKNLFLQYVSILICVFFTVITFSKTKILWYAYPLYPFLGIAIAIVCHEFAATLSESWRSRWLRCLATWMILAYIAAVIAMLACTREKPNVASYLKNHFSYEVPRDYKLIVDDLNQYDGSLEFQIQRYAAQTHHQIVKATLDQIHVGDWLIVSGHQLHQINARYEIAVESYSKPEDFGVYKMRAKL